MSLDVYLSPPPCPHCGRSAEPFDANITHNLNDMAKEAGIYLACWRPEEIGIQKAADLVPLLRAGLHWLKTHEAEARRHDPPNGWGSYDGFVPWVERYLQACIERPDASVRVSR